MIQDEVMSPGNAVNRWLEEQWAQFPHEFSVNVEDAAIRCRGWGLEHANKPGIVLVHGFRAHARWWDHIAPSLSETHRVVAMDLSGMGDSDRRPVYSRVQYGREILAVAAFCGFDPFTLITHSFGTMGGLLATTSAPERVKRFVMIDAGLPLTDEGEFKIAVPPQRFYPSYSAAIERFRLIPPGGWPIPGILDYIAHHGVCQTSEGWTWKFDPAAAISLNAERFRDQLGPVMVPVDVIHGDRSEIMIPERIAEARRIAPDCGTPLSIPASHHHIMIEQPIALIAALRGLLANERV